MSAEHSIVSPCADQTLPGYRDSEWLREHAAALIPVYRGKGHRPRIVAYATVDEADFGLVSSHRWFLVVQKKFLVRYARAHLGYRNGRCVQCRMHQLLVKAAQVDHVNRDGLDNRRSNIRPASGQQNIANQGLRRTSKTGYRGVRYVSRDELFQARLVTGKKEVSLGYFANKHEAAFAYNCASRIVFHEFAFMNRLSECDVPDSARREAIHAYVAEQISRRGVTRI